MELKTVILEKKAGIARITLNRPEALNAMNMELLSGLRQALEEARRDEDVAVIILRGAGRAFCAGGDLKVWNEHFLQGGGEEDLALGPERAREIMELMDSIEKPIICAVHGYAVTGGFLLAYFSDIVIASEDAVFQDTHAKWGLVPSGYENIRLPMVVGIFNAKRIFFTSDRITAQEAAQMGLIYKVVPREKLDEEVEELAARLLKQSRYSLAAIKTQINTCMKVDWSTAVQMDSLIRKGLIGSFVTQDGESRLRGFPEKRKT